MVTYYVEATIVSTGVLMQDSGMTQAQVDHLRGAESRGIISGLYVAEDLTDAGQLARMFGGR